MLSTYGKSRKTFTLSLGILPKIRKCVPLFQKNFHSHRVYFQKNWNRSRFFQIFPEKVVHRVYCQNFEKRSGFAELVSEKFAHIWYIAKNHETVLAFSELFWKSAHQVYFQNFWNRSRFSKLFSKNLSLASSGRPDIGISTILYAPIRQIRQISPLPGLFPKRHPVVLLLSEKIPKNIISHHWLSQLPPCFVTPFFNFFSKIFVSPLLTITFLPRKGHTCSKNFSKKNSTLLTITFFLRFVSAFLKKSWKILPIGNKKLMAGYNQQQSSRTGILTPAALREICIYYCYWTGYIRILRLIMYSAKQSLNLQGDT